MTLPIYTSAAFTNSAGVAVAANASVEVRRESDDSLVPIFQDAAGQNQITQPGFQTDTEGRFQFYASPDAEGWKITVSDGLVTHTLNSQFPQGGVFGIPEGEEAEWQSQAQGRVDAHAAEEGGVHGIPAGERALHTADNLSATPLGGYVTVQTDLAGAEEPDPETHIKLTADDPYNAGKLDNESVSGSAPLVEATAEIVDLESPLNGQIVHLLNTEGRFIVPGETAGAVANDVMRAHSHRFGAEFAAEQGGNRIIIRGNNDTIVDAATDNISKYVSDGNADFSGVNGGTDQTKFMSDHTKPKHIQTTYYMRIK